MSDYKKYKYELGLIISDKYMDNFVEEDYLNVKAIYRDAHKYSKLEWNTWIEQTKGNRVIQSAIAANIFANSEAIELLLKTGRTFKETNEILLQRNNLDTKTMLHILAKSTDRTITDIMINQREGEKVLSEKILDIILNHLYEDLKKAKPSYKEHQLLALEFTENDEIINKILDIPYIPEYVNNHIIENKHLKEETRNRAFELGCNYSAIKNHTRKTALEIYKSIADGMETYETIRKTSSDWILQRTYAESLSNILSGNHVNVAVEIDAINRIMDTAIPLDYIDVIYSIAENTPNRTTISYLRDVVKDKSYNLEVDMKLFNNPYALEDIRSTIINENLKKLQLKSTPKTEKKAIMQFFIDHLDDKNVNLTPKEVDKIIEIFEHKSTYAAKDIMATLAATHYITNDQLLKLSEYFEKFGFSIEKPYISDLNLLMRENGCSEKDASTLCSKYRRCYYPYDIEEGDLKKMYDICLKYKESHDVEYPFETLTNNLGYRAEKYGNRNSIEMTTFMKIKEKEPKMKYQFQFYLEYDEIIRLLNQRTRERKEKREISDKEKEI